MTTTIISMDMGMDVVEEPAARVVPATPANSPTSAKAPSAALTYAVAMLTDTEPLPQRTRYALRQSTLQKQKETEERQAAEIRRSIERTIHRQVSRQLKKDMDAMVGLFGAVSMS